MEDKNMNFSISTIPNSNQNIENEIKLIKSVLLYADDITINSINATMLNIINSIHMEKYSFIEITKMLEKVNPFIKMVDLNMSKDIESIIQTINNYSPLFKKKYRSGKKLIAIDKLTKHNKELESYFSEIIKIINDILISAGYRELEKANKIVKFEEYKCTIDSNEDIIKEYFDKVLDATTSFSKFPVFDEGTSNLIRLYEKENKNIRLNTYSDKNSHGAIVSNLFLQIPALDFLSIEQLLELRESLKQYLINFRKAIYKFSTKIGCAQWNEEFDYEVTKLYNTEVLPQIEELKQKINENSLIEKILKENYIDKVFWTTLVSTIGMSLSSSNTLLQGIVNASFIGNTTCNIVNSAFNYQKESQEIKNNIMYFYYKATEKMNHIVNNNTKLHSF